MGLGFNYERAARTLAESTYYGKRAACSKFHVSPRTFDNWKARLKTDEQLNSLYRQHLNNYEKKLDGLRDLWQEEAVGTLRACLKAIKTHLAITSTEKLATTRDREAWAKQIDSLAKAVKSIGDLAVATYVLIEDDDSEGETDVG